MNRPIVRQGSSQGPRAPSKSKTGRVKIEEHKSRVINTSKNIYKPCFNMPAKDNTSTGNTVKTTPSVKKETGQPPKSQRPPVTPIVQAEKTSEAKPS
jgi:hypothetical protein